MRESCARGTDAIFKHVIITCYHVSICAQDLGGGSHFEFILPVSAALVRISAMEILGGQEGMYDNALMGILQSCGKLQPFLDAVFSFLARRTDFYIIMQHDRAKMGFFPGVAEGMVMQAFKKYEILTRKREAEIMREEETKRIEQMTHDTTHDELPISLPAPQEAEGTSKETSSAEGDTHPPPSDTTPPKPPESVEERKEMDDNEVPKSKEKGGAERQDRTAAFNLSSDTYNGAVMDNYKWSQTVTDIDIRVPVPEGTTSKHVKVDIKSDHLKVELLWPEHQVSTLLLLEDNLDSKTFCVSCYNVTASPLAGNHRQTSSAPSKG